MTNDLHDMWRVVRLIYGWSLFLAWYQLIYRDYILLICSWALWSALLCLRSARFLNEYQYSYLTMHIISVATYSQGKPSKYPNVKITIPQKCVNTFVLNFAHLFRRRS